jgi:hypothetical protein
MQRVRRLALVVVLVLVGGVILAGCRSQPGVAAYVGDKEYTVRQIDDIVDRIVKLNAQRAQEQSGQLPIPISRQLVLGLMVYGDLQAELLTQRGLSPSSGNVQGVASVYALPVGDLYTQLLGTYFDRFQVLRQSASGPEASRDQVLRFYRAGVDGGAFPAGVPDEQVVAGLNATAVGAEFAAQAVIEQAAKEKHIVVNPRYAPLPMPTLVSQQGPRIVLLPPAKTGESFVSGA